MTVDEDFTPQDVEDLRYLLSDALCEFAAHRDDVDAYVRKRHEKYGMTDAEVEKKRVQVRRRVRLARKLHNAAIGHTVEAWPSDLVSAVSAVRAVERRCYHCSQIPSDCTCLKPCDFCGWTSAEGCPNAQGKCPERG